MPWPGCTMLTTTNPSTRAKGKGGQHFEVDQRAHTRAAEFLHVFHLGDAQHHRGEDDGSEDHLRSV